MLTNLNLRPTDDGMDSKSREHTFFSKANAGQLSKINDQVISNTLRTRRKLIIAVLRNITDDHYPILSDVPLEAVNFDQDQSYLHKRGLLL